MILSYSYFPNKILEMELECVHYWISGNNKGVFGNQRIRFTFLDITGSNPYHGIWRSVDFEDLRIVEALEGKINE